MMKFIIPLCMASILPTLASTEVLVPVRTIRIGEVLSETDLRPIDLQSPGAIKPGSDIAGLEARVTLFANQPFARNDLRDPRLVHRNEKVTLLYVSPGLTIQSEGRALSDGSIGNSVTVMNLESRTKVSGTVQADGSVLVAKRSH